MALATPEERRTALLALQAALFIADMNGFRFDDELKQLADRALAGDETIDATELALRMNAALPGSTTDRPETWEFSKGLRASCEHFSIAVPDDHRVIEDYDKFGSLQSPLPFVVLSNEVEGDDIPQFNWIACTAYPMDNLEQLADYGTEELIITQMRMNMNNTEPGCYEDWVVQGKNCPVVVMHLEHVSSGHEYQIRPVIAQTGYFVRCLCEHSSAEHEEIARNVMFAMAESVEATPPFESEFTRKLKRLGTQKVAPEEFASLAQRLLGFLRIFVRCDHDSTETQYLNHASNPTFYELTQHVVLGTEALFKRIWPLFTDLTEALLFQKTQGASTSELEALSALLGGLAKVFIIAELADTRGSAEFYRDHGPIALPDGFRETVRDAVQFLEGRHEEILAELEHNNEMLQQSIRDHINDPDRPVFEEEDDEGDADAGQGPAAEAETGDVDYPALFLTLLSDYWIYFEDDEITWDGRHHTIAGVHLNARKAKGLLHYVNSCIPGFEDTSEVVQYLIAFLNEAEKDEGLKVPRGMIAPGVRKAIYEGDLTGLTLASLAACGGALGIQKTGAAAYRVVLDRRLVAGIPRFLDLVARLIWDLRQCAASLQGKPFKLAFVIANTIDANAWLGSVDTPVPGAQEFTMSMEVTDAPRIALPSEIMVDEHQEKADRKLAPEDSRALSLVSELVRELPCTKPISGTHHKGRAARIEHVHAGDRLILAADWNCPYFNPAGIEVFNEQGETLGYLEGVSGPKRGALALLLPHITAIVASVTPLSRRRKGSKYALMDVHMELDTDTSGTEAVDDLIADARRIISLPKGERTVKSHADGPTSQAPKKGDTREAELNDIEPASRPKSHDASIDTAESGKDKANGALKRRSVKKAAASSKTTAAPKKAAASKQAAPATKQPAAPKQAAPATKQPAAPKKAAATTQPDASKQAASTPKQAAATKRTSASKQPAAPKQAAPATKQPAAPKKAAATTGRAVEIDLEPKIPAPTTSFKPKHKPKPLHLKNVPGIKNADLSDLRRGFPAEEDGGSDRTLDLMRQMAQTVKRSRIKEVTAYLKGPNGADRATTLAIRYNYVLCELASSELMAVERHLRYCTPDDAIAEMIACVRTTLQLVTRDLAVPKVHNTTLNGIYVPSAVGRAHSRMIACEKQLANESEKRAALREQKERSKKEEREITGARDAFNDSWKLFEKSKRKFELAWNQAKMASAQSRASAAGCDLTALLPNKNNAGANRHAANPWDLSELNNRHKNLKTPLKTYLSSLIAMRAKAYRLLEVSERRTNQDLRHLGIDLKKVNTCSRYIDTKTARSVAMGCQEPTFDPALLAQILKWLQLKRDQSLILDFGAELQRCQAKLDELEAERCGLGFFAFKKKRAIADEIKTVNEQAANLSDAAAAEASLHAEDLAMYERNALRAIKSRFGRAADDLKSLNEFLMQPDLR